MITKINFILERSNLTKIIIYIRKERQIFLCKKRETETDKKIETATKDHKKKNFSEKREEKK